MVKLFYPIHFFGSEKEENFEGGIGDGDPSLDMRSQGGIVYLRTQPLNSTLLRPKNARHLRAVPLIEDELMMILKKAFFAKFLLYVLLI